jgi:small subunit ribosomal protein S6
MTLPPPTYDLTLLLDPEAEEDVRAKIVADARAAIEARGELTRQDDWGKRSLTYPIDRKSAAEYHLLQFHAGTPELLHDLDRTLRITDGILRFRIIKLRPGVPDAPDMRAASAASTSTEAPPAASGETAIEVEAVVEIDAEGEPEIEAIVVAEAEPAEEALVPAEPVAEAEPAAVGEGEPGADEPA